MNEEPLRSVAGVRYSTIELTSSDGRTLRTSLNWVTGHQYLSSRCAPNLSVPPSSVVYDGHCSGPEAFHSGLLLSVNVKVVKIDHEEAESRSSASVTSAESSNPVVDRGTMLRAASGKTYVVLSAFYGGANATLYRPRTVAGPPLSRRCGVDWRRTHHPGSYSSRSNARRKF